MSRHMLSLCHEPLTSCDLDTCVAHAETLNQHHREVCMILCPKAPRRGSRTMHAHRVPLS